VQAQATAEPDDRLDSFGQIVYAYISANPGPENFSDPSFALTPVRVLDTDIDYKDDCEDADGSESGAGSTDTLRANVLSSASRNIVGDGDNDQDDFPPCTDGQVKNFIGIVLLALGAALVAGVACTLGVLVPAGCVATIIVFAGASLVLSGLVQDLRCQLPGAVLAGVGECPFGQICT
ncbi:MAG: hypothetical protein ACREQ5_40605, partial [Candidatus Dormibacteria bacterium]